MTGASVRMGNTMRKSWRMCRMGYGIFFFSLALSYSVALSALSTFAPIHLWEYGLVALFWGIWLGYTGYNLMVKRGVYE